jgi:PAS domain S-box-containing protein
MVERMLRDADRERRRLGTRVLAMGASVVSALLGIFAAFVERNAVGATIALTVGILLGGLGLRPASRLGELFVVCVVATGPIVNLVVLALGFPIASNPYWLTATLVASTVLLAPRALAVVAAGVFAIFGLEAIVHATHPSPPLPISEALATAMGIAATTGAMAWAIATSARQSLRKAIVRELDARDAEERQRLAEDRYRLIANHTSDLVAVFDESANVLYASPSHERVFGQSVNGAEVSRFHGLLGADAAEAVCLLEEVIARGVARREVVIQPGERKLTLDVVMTSVRTQDGVRIIATGRDVTEERQLATRLQQVQKMEAVGRLAGGIAHDFNNLLSAMGSAASLALEQLPKAHPATADVSDVVAGVERGTAMTRRLLAISRKQMPQLEEPARVAHSLETLERLLLRVLPGNIRLQIEHAGIQQAVVASESELEQILLNLVLNARDAMPDGGQIQIRAASRTLVDAEVSLLAGDYVTISITDTGTGMSADVQHHLFEPFFTTKTSGSGTGLGLATALGIATQHGGTLQVETTLGQGTTFTLWLPIASGGSVAVSRSDIRAISRSLRPLTLLLLEDDPLVLASTTRVLKSLGHQVHGTSTGKDAIQLSDEGLRIDVLVADLNLADGLSYDAVDHILARQPDVSLIFISGYAEDPTRLAQYLRSGAHLLPKPFSRSSLFELLQHCQPAASSRPRRHDAEADGTSANS